MREAAPWRRRKSACILRTMRSRKLACECMRGGRCEAMYRHVHVHSQWAWACMRALASFWSIRSLCEADVNMMRSASSSRPCHKGGWEGGEGKGW